MTERKKGTGKHHQYPNEKELKPQSKHFYLNTSSNNTSIYCCNNNILCHQIFRDRKREKTFTQYAFTFWMKKHDLNGDAFTIHVHATNC